ncbi:MULTISPECIES: DUF6474 family protein [unclassified Corynebacterium]|uniref:DUF6474 family protein n=1 Tax=unclassified Corynebacterium TaxID=2624378 RepID=UPI00264E9F5A|nr:MULTISPECIES: DUF6474 family protein [unclassified Corynebacterium]MDN8595478.1 DUF6474 family protein [Corynebacterium sp. P4_F2]WKK55252.1 DUF6474 family protein [Corynebacterium sp. P4-C1]WKK62661.1 DUF6474 family protein [Corynebacterium sp. P8-C1]
MGLFETIRASRAKTKAEIKAAEARARQLAKDEAKHDKRTAKLLDKAEKRLLKEEKKGLKNKQKHEKQLAKTELQKIQEAGLTKKKAKQWVGASRILLPVLIPLVYRALTAYQERQVNDRARAAGLTANDIARFSSQGAELKGRVQTIRREVDGNDALDNKFRRDAKVRLDELDAAVNNVEQMNDAQRRLAHETIDRDINKLTAEIQEKTLRK